MSETKGVIEGSWKLGLGANGKALKCMLLPYMNPLLLSIAPPNGPICLLLSSFWFYSLRILMFMQVFFFFYA